MKTTHTKQNKESTDKSLNKEISVKKRIFFDSLIVIFVAISPFIAYSYLAAPDGEIWETPFFTLTKNGFSSLDVAVWIYVGKLVPLYLMIFWFITCKHWWYHIILVPITLYSFQLFTVLNKTSKMIDENESLWVIIVLMFVAPVVYIIRLRLYDRLVLGIDLKKIEAELDEYDRKEKEAQNVNELK
jgi:dipeptide/tripeptide permease